MPATPIHPGSNAQLTRSRVLLVGLEPWGAVAAADLAAMGVSALHVLDDARVSGDDLDAVRFFSEADRGKDRAMALKRALASRVPSCVVTTGALVAAAGQPLALDDSRWDVVLVCVPGDDLLVQESAAIFAQTAGLSSITGRLEGLTAVVGPAVVPGRTACWACAHLRRLACSRNPRVEHALSAALRAARPPRRARTYLPSMPGVLGHLLALAASSLIVSGTSAPIAGRVLTRHLIRPEPALHTVLPLPWCELCGGARAVQPIDAAVPDLSRAREPAELMRMLAGVVDARTGIVREVRVGCQDTPYQVDTLATASAVLGAYSACALHDHPREPDDGSGRGHTVVEAMIGAVAEAIERYSARRVDPGGVLRASVSEMKADHLPPDRLSLYADHQLDTPGFPFVRLSPQTPIDWVVGRWLDTGEEVYLPALPTHYDYHAPAGEAFCQVTSNGLAAGPDAREAALRATLELCERDAFTLSWLARLPGKRVALDASLDPRVREIARHLAADAGRLDVHLLDAGLGVPVALAVSYGDGVRWPGASVSLGAHLCPRRAVERAILEHAQGGPYYRRLVEEGKQPIPAQPDDVRTLIDHAAYYFPRERAVAFDFLREGELISAGDLPRAEEISLEALSARITAAGLRVAIADLTSPDLMRTPFRVARALGAQFQQIHFGQRLARLGNPRLVALAGKACNPDPHPLD